MLKFTKENFHPLCDELAAKNKLLQLILSEYGYPPFWIRPNSFETLVLTILEQQVSLASAYAAYKKLKGKLQNITPKKVLQLSDEELKACYLSRQKIVYVRELANAILSKRINLKQLAKENDDVVRKQLKALKGIGDWTVDIYLLHALLRADIFPVGDLALLNAIKMVMNKQLTKDEIVVMAEAWKPCRSIATMMFWHYYIKKKNIKLLH